MSISIHRNIVYGPEEEPIPAHLSYGQFLYDKFKSGENKTALVCDAYLIYKTISYIVKILY